MATSDWCLTEDKSIGLVGSPTELNRTRDSYGNVVLKGIKYAKKMRCPDCNKQLATFTRECDDPGCVHLYLPKHKKPHKKR